MYIKRAIEKDVHHCSECPYYDEVLDMGATIPRCLKVRELDPHYEYDDRLSINWQEANYKIDKYCPFLLDN